MLHADNCLPPCPRSASTSHRLRTNTQSATAFRGFGGPQGMLGMERMIDHLAHTLGPRPGGTEHAATTIGRWCPLPGPLRRGRCLPPRRLRRPPPRIFQDRRTSGRGRPDAHAARRHSGGIACLATARSGADHPLSAWTVAGLHPPRPGGRKTPEQTSRLRRPPSEGGDCRLERRPTPILKRGLALLSRQVRYLLHADPPQPGRRPRPRLSGRVDQR